MHTNANWGTIGCMRIAKPKPPGVYIEIRDRRRRRKSESLTVEGLTPQQTIQVIVRAIRDHLRKAV